MSTYGLGFNIGLNSNVANEALAINILNATTISPAPGASFSVVNTGVEVADSGGTPAIAALKIHEGTWYIFMPFSEPQRTGTKYIVIRNTFIKVAP